jgi:hypothetical protein
MKRKLIFLLIPLFLLVMKANASTSQAGAIFLIIYPGARPNGMGATFTAIADDALASYYNDAGLGFQRQRDFVLMHSNWLPGLYGGMYYEFIGVTYPVPAYGGVLGVHVIYLTTGETVATDMEGNLIAQWITFDSSIKLSYGTQLRENLSVGVGAKFIISYLSPSWVLGEVLPGVTGGGTGTSWAFDISSFYKIFPKRVRIHLGNSSYALTLNEINIGASLQNLGPNIKYTDTGESDPLPWTLRIGSSYKAIKSESNELSISTEFTKILVGIGGVLGDLFKGSRTVEKEGKEVTENRWTILKYEYHDIWKALGLEYSYSNLFSLRAGFFWDTIGHRVGPTFGGGVYLKDLAFDIGVDQYIYEVPTSNYRFSLSYKF